VSLTRGSNFGVFLAGDADYHFVLSLQLLQALEAVAVVANQQFGSARVVVVALVAQVAVQNVLFHRLPITHIMHFNQQRILQ
jgi:hypothetical protein